MAKDDEDGYASYYEEQEFLKDMRRAGDYAMGAYQNDDWWEPENDD